MENPQDDKNRRTATTSDAPSCCPYGSQGATAVSYTHLDVYKRQGYLCTAPIEQWQLECNIHAFFIRVATPAF